MVGFNHPKLLQDFTTILSNISDLDVLMYRIPPGGMEADHLENEEPRGCPAPQKDVGNGSNKVQYVGTGLGKTGRCIGAVRIYIQLIGLRERLQENPI